MGEENGRHATIELVNEKIKSLRWELRAYVLGLSLLFLSKINVPQDAAAAALHHLPF